MKLDRTTMMAFMVTIADMLREDGLTEEQWHNWAHGAWNVDAILGSQCEHCGGSGRLMLGKHVISCIADAHGPAHYAAMADIVPAYKEKLAAIRAKTKRKI